MDPTLDLEPLFPGVELDMESFDPNDFPTQSPEPAPSAEPEPIQTSPEQRDPRIDPLDGELPFPEFEMDMENIDISDFLEPSPEPAPVYTSPEQRTSAAKPFLNIDMYIDMSDVPDPISEQETLRYLRERLVRREELTSYYEVKKKINPKEHPLFCYHQIPGTFFSPEQSPGEQQQQLSIEDWFGKEYLPHVPPTPSDFFDLDPPFPLHAYLRPIQDNSSIPRLLVDLRQRDQNHAVSRSRNHVRLLCQNDPRQNPRGDHPCLDIHRLPSSQRRPQDASQDTPQDTPRAPGLRPGPDVRDRPAKPEEGTKEKQQCSEEEEQGEKEVDFTEHDDAADRSARILEAQVQHQDQNQDQDRDALNDTQNTTVQDDNQDNIETTVQDDNSDENHSNDDGGHPSDPVQPGEADDDDEYEDNDDDDDDDGDDDDDYDEAPSRPTRSRRPQSSSQPNRNPPSTRSRRNHASARDNRLPGSGKGKGKGLPPGLGRSKGKGPPPGLGRGKGKGSPLPPPISNSPAVRSSTSARNNNKKSSGWSDAEGLAAIAIMKRIFQDPIYEPIRDTERRFAEISKQLQSRYGFSRSQSAVKNQWNRYLRQESGFEDRGVKKHVGSGLVTSALNKARAGKKRASSGASDDHHDDDDDDNAVEAPAAVPSNSRKRKRDQDDEDEADVPVPSKRPRTDNGSYSTAGPGPSTSASRQRPQNDNSSYGAAGPGPSTTASRKRHREEVDDEEDDIISSRMKAKRSRTIRRAQQEADEELARRMQAQFEEEDGVQDQEEDVEDAIPSIETDDAELAAHLQAQYYQDTEEDGQGGEDTDFEDDDVAEAGEDEGGVDAVPRTVDDDEEFARQLQAQFDLEIRSQG